MATKRKQVERVPAPGPAVIVSRGVAYVEFHGFEGGKPTLHRVEVTPEELAAGIEVPAYTQRVAVKMVRVLDL